MKPNKQQKETKAMSQGRPLHQEQEDIWEWGLSGINKTRPYLYFDCIWTNLSLKTMIVGKERSGGDLDWVSFIYAAEISWQMTGNDR